MFKRVNEYFLLEEKILFCVSIIVILTVYFVFRQSNLLSLFASLIGVTSLTLNAKGNPVGQLLTILFSLIYGYLSFQVTYYGEMLTYLCMTAPMALIAFISWMRHRVDGKKNEVLIRKMNWEEILVMVIATLLVTFIFYFVLRYFGTANLFFSTLSVTTSFLAVFMTWRRTPFYAIGYAANDIVLIILWSLQIGKDNASLPMVLCFLAFLANDLYGFYNWNRLYRKQNQ